MIGSQGEKELQKLYGTEKKAASFYEHQMLNFLNPVMKDFIANQDMVFISTSDKQGNCDSSFRSGEAGFVKVIDDHKLVYPEFRGNGIFASLGNIYENPHIGLLFIDFFNNGIGLHVNGSASIMNHEDLDDHLDADYAERWVMIHVEEAYIHCSKHIPLLQKKDKKIHWGTDEERHKSGDFFKAKQANRP